MHPKPVIKPATTNVAGLFAGLTLGINFVAGSATAAPIEPPAAPSFLSPKQALLLSVRKGFSRRFRTAPRSDRDGLWMFYAARTQPVWVDKGGFLHQR